MLGNAAKRSFLCVQILLIYSYLVELFIKPSRFLPDVVLQYVLILVRTSNHEAKCGRFRALNAIFTSILVLV